MSYKIVVARHAESIDWLQSEMSNCIIYNKGTPLNIKNEVCLDNVGRESDTYLHYIINNYNNLPDVIVFTQGLISDHIAGGDVDWLLDIKNEALFYSKSQNYMVHNDIGKNINWDKEWNLRKGEYYLKDNYKNNMPRKFIDWYKEYIGPTYPTPMKIYVAALFAVKKELILANQLEYYKHLRLQVNHHVNPSEGHFLERSWYYIFSCSCSKERVTAGWSSCQNGHKSMQNGVKSTVASPCNIIIKQEDEDEETSVAPYCHITIKQEDEGSPFVIIIKVNQKKQKQTIVN
jgi:hypothetical protein